MHTIEIHYIHQFHNLKLKFTEVTGDMAIRNIWLEEVSVSSISVPTMIRNHINKYFVRANVWNITQAKNISPNALLNFNL